MTNIRALPSISWNRIQNFNSEIFTALFLCFALSIGSVDLYGVLSQSTRNLGTILVKYFLVYSLHGITSPHEEYKYLCTLEGLITPMTPGAHKTNYPRGS